MIDKDDTQPRSPFQGEAPPQGTYPPPQVGYQQEPPPPYNDGVQGPGCFIWGIVGSVILVLGLAIVGLSGAAGWTSGVSTAEENATATVSRRIAQQFEQIPTDIAAGNREVLQFRLDYLFGVTPGVQGLTEIQQTATQLAVNLVPTITPTATITPTPTELPPEVTESAQAEAPEDTFVADSTDNGGYDLDGLLLEAQRQIDLAQYEDAIDTLDVIMAIDLEYRTEIVRNLMGRALRNYATNLYQSIDTVAEAILITDRAEEFGPVGDLSYERLIGSLFLDAQRTIDLGNYVAAINSLQQILNYQGTYKDVNISEEIFSQYVAYGDSLVATGQACSAVAQYNSALNIFNNNSVTGARDAAQETCQQGISLTPAPGTTDSDTEGVAPVGQPGG